jgi:hypothetical protein
METILAHAQELVSTLSSLMPTPYQKDNLEAMLALFLEAQGHPLPEHSKNQVSQCVKSIFKYQSMVNPKSVFAQFVATYLSESYPSVPKVADQTYR